MLLAWIIECSNELLGGPCYYASMVKAVVTDFSKVLLFAKDSSYADGLNALNKQLLARNPSYDFFDCFY